VEYKNGEVQDTESSEDIGTHVNDLILELMSYFEEKEQYDEDIEIE